MSGTAWAEPTARFLSGWGGGAVHIEDPEVDWDGRAVYRAVLPGDRRVLVKVDSDGVRHRRELGGLLAARAGGAPVPRVLASGADGGRHHIVLEEIPTRVSLADGGTGWRAAGAAAARLHDSPVPEGMRMFCEGGGEDWVEHLTHRFDVECAEAVRRGLLSPVEAGLALAHTARVFAEAGPGRRALLHGDLQARHVLAHDGDVVLVDFGDAGWGDPVLDLVVLTHWAPEHLGEVLDGYGADDALRTRVGMLWTTYSLWRHLFVSRWYHENAFDRQRSALAARKVLCEQVLPGHSAADTPPPRAERLVLECDVVLVDFDGLLVDTEFAGWRSWSEIFAGHGTALSIRQWASDTGSNTPPSPWDSLDAVAGAPVDRAVVEARRRVRRDTVMAVLPGAVEFLRSCRARGLRIGLVSNSPRRWIDRQTRNLALDRDLFDVVVTGDGYPPKPAPDSYLAALAEFATDRDRVVAVEDSGRGVAAAKAAGLRCVAVPNRVTVHTDLSHADHVVGSLADLRLERRVTR